MSLRTAGHSRTIRVLAAVIGTTGATAVVAASASAAPTVSFTQGVLRIDGDPADNGLTVGRTPAGTVTLNGNAVLGGTVPVAGVQAVRIDGGAGNDTLRLDERNGVMPHGQLFGGTGSDAIFGGSRADSLNGGAGSGIDRVVGGPGDDTVSLGEGSDQFTWNPGDGSDRVDGNAGADTLIFNGSDRTPFDPFESEVIDFGTDRSRTTIRRLISDPGDPLSETEITLSVSGFELVKARMLGGPNAVLFERDFSSSDVGVVRLDLGPPTDQPRDRGPNSVAVVGSPGDDRIRIGGTRAAGATVTGLGPAAVITGAELFVVQGGLGDDVIDASGLEAGTVGRLEEFGGSEHDPADSDTLIGHPGSDGLFGGTGDDRLEGRGGNDILDGGSGNNVIIP